MLEFTIFMGALWVLLDLSLTSELICNESCLEESNLGRIKSIYTYTQQICIKEVGIVGGFCKDTAMKFRTKEVSTFVSTEEAVLQGCQKIVVCGYSLRRA